MYVVNRLVQDYGSNDQVLSLFHSTAVNWFVFTGSLLLLFCYNWFVFQFLFVCCFLLDIM